MNCLNDATVAEIAAGSLAAVRVFEKYGIDYCCGGKRPLDEACRQKRQNPQIVHEELEHALNQKPATERDWAMASLQELIEYIIETHHGFLRRELPAIQARLEKVYRVYNERYGPTLIRLPEVFADLREELEPHLQKEETILFPAIQLIEEAAVAAKVSPKATFGTVANSIHSMEMEHDRAGEALRKIRDITGDFALPEYACVTYKALMGGLAELGTDLHLHIHLENNVLFPRAIELETSCQAGR